MHFVIHPAKKKLRKYDEVLGNSDGCVTYFKRLLLSENFIVKSKFHFNEFQCIKLRIYNLFFK